MNGPIPILLMVRALGLGGTERQVTAIAKSLDRSVFSPHVGCLHAEGSRVGELQNAGIPIVHFPLRSLLRPSVVAAARQMGLYLRQNQIQLVHSFDVPMNLFGAPTAWAYRTRAVISSQRASRDLTSGWHRILLRITDRMVNAIVVNCEAMRTHLVNGEGAPADRIHVCPNGIDTTEFRRRPSRTASGGLTIGVVCLLRPEKDLATLLRAFAQVRPLSSGLTLAIVGSGPALPDMEAISRELGITDLCCFVPATDRVTDRLHSMDVFVLPSRTEGLSNSLMEAMACGCAAVASRVGGNVELIEHGRTGLLFESGNVTQLAAQLQALIEQPCLREDLAAEGSRFIRENYSLPAAVRRMSEIYQQVLN